MLFRIVFFGSSHYVAPILETLISSSEQHHWQVSAVITQPDRPAGRKQILTPTPIKQLAQKHGIHVLTPEKISDPSAIEQIKAIKPDLLVVSYYAQKIPLEILNLPIHGSLCVHPSLLPNYRGTSPAQAAILDNEQETGVTIFLMDKQFDHGPIITQEKISILSTDTNQSLYTKLYQLAADMLTNVIERYIKGDIKPEEQNHTLATYSQFLTRESGEVRELVTAHELERMIRAYNPWPGVWMLWRGKRVKILKAHGEKEEKLIIDEIQLEGKKPVLFEEFMRGFPDFTLPLKKN